jgi:hypothetical protein
VEQIDKLSEDDRADVGINLHAFVLNTFGVTDNLAWVFVHENGLLGSRKAGKIDKNGVGLFQEATQTHLSRDLVTYLKSDRPQSWHKNYLKVYRDALAHRIPLYVPPCGLNKEEAEKYQLSAKKLGDFSSLEAISSHDQAREELSRLGRPLPWFAASAGEEGAPIILHAQVLVDFATIQEITGKFCDALT